MAATGQPSALSTAPAAVPVAVPAGANSAAPTTAPSDAAISFEDVALSFGGETIYAGLNFSVGRGEFVCLLGPSGCGKSTALRLIGDLIQPAAGRVQVGGKAPAQAWQDVAFVFQSPRLAPWRNALDNVMLGAELRSGRGPARQHAGRAADLLRLVGLAEAARKYPSMLSGGERQRVAIARALMVEPAIVLMDEPFSALDPNTRRRLRAEIERIWLETGRTVVFVTHDIDEALVLADRIVLLSNKPTRVLETIAITAARPRALEEDPALQALRGRLQALFQSLESQPDEPEKRP
jgi:NitT/TauT family transport system ATP-binding protein